MIISAEKGKQRPLPSWARSGVWHGGGKGRAGCFALEEERITRNCAGVLFREKSGNSLFKERGKEGGNREKRDEEEE